MSVPSTRIVGEPGKPWRAASASPVISITSTAPASRPARPTAARSISRACFHEGQPSHHSNSTFGDIRFSFAQSLFVHRCSPRDRSRAGSRVYYAEVMCRNIRTLHNFEPAATDEEIRASALQYVRKVSGSNKPSQANVEAFDRAVDQVELATRTLLDGLVTSAPPKDRE